MPGSAYPTIPPCCSEGLEARGYLRGYTVECGLWLQHGPRRHDRNVTLGRLLRRLPSATKEFWYACIEARLLYADIIEYKAADFFLVIGIVANSSGRCLEALRPCDLGQKLILAIRRGDEIALHALIPILALDREGGGSR